MNEERNSKAAEALRMGAAEFFAKSAGQPAPGNERVIAEFQVSWDTKTGLTAFGNVRPKYSPDNIDLLVVAFVSPDYEPGVKGKYYAGTMTGLYLGGPKPSDLGLGFGLQSQQFTEADKGKTVLVGLQGWVEADLFSFEKEIVIGG